MQREGSAFQGLGVVMLKELSDHLTSVRMRVLEWLASCPSLRAVLVGVFAGITDLGEFADLLATGIERTPNLHAPIVARLVGRGAAEARHILAERQPAVFVTEDLGEAMQRIEAITGATRA